MPDVRPIGVIMGGVSAERDVSLASGRAIAAALERRGHRIVTIDAGKELPEVLARENVGFAFLALHGGWGENGGVQGLLEVMGIPYTGSGILASALAMDKIVSRTLFVAAGLAVADGVTYEGGNVDRDPPFAPPWVVKPAREGSSIGVSIVHEQGKLAGAVRKAATESSVLVEAFIPGVEIQVGILGEEAVGSVEVRPENEFYDYEAKYTAGKTRYILPPEVDDVVEERCRKVALQAHHALGCRGVSRVDLRVPEDGEPRVLEVNTLPGMTETSLLPKIAAAAGIPFEGLVERILEHAGR